LWLLSTIRTGESRSAFFTENINEYDWLKTKNDVFITSWGVFKYDELNPTYFKFNDKSNYVKIE
jgi:hypothetical protein